MRRGLPLLALLTALGGCATQPVTPIGDAADVGTLSGEETRLWNQAEEFDQALVRSGKLHRDDALETYVQTVMDGLYPELDGAVRVHIVRSPTLNAFALPNGSIYVHLGLLARLENEAQLATVLAHEAGHFVDKHALRQRRNVKTSTAFAASVGMVGIPLVGEVLAVSSIYGYSRDLERDADAIAYERLAGAGYRTAEAVRVFEHLAAEVEALDVDEPYFFSSHPRLQERIETFERLAEGPAARDGRVAAGRYLQATAEARVECLRLDLSMNRHESVLLALQREDTDARYPAHYPYYLGEAFRKRGADGDRARAAQAYRRAVRTAPDFAPSYRALGVHHLKAGDYGKARRFLKAYLQRAPQAPDRGYVEQYLRQAKNKENAG
ncbi:MAG: M48 family metalloprotease [Gammaproteobacteria bacterium]|nr:M48 family metalloprotease [Gammaproteobacteria bacterium]